MFPKIFGKDNKEEKSMLDAENRQRDFQREQQQLEGTMHDDPTYQYAVEGRNDLLRWQQDLDDEVMSLIETMLGKVKVIDRENNEFYWADSGEPLCNKLFITEVVIPSCKPFMTRSLINSNWDRTTILNRLRMSCDTIANSMADNWDRFNISFLNYDMVLNQIKTTIIAGAYRALNGWTKRIDSTMVKRIESTNEMMNKQQENKKGIWGVFNSG